MDESKIMLAVMFQVKEYLKTKEMRASKDIGVALSNKIRMVLDIAVESAKADKRRTVMMKDFE